MSLLIKALDNLDKNKQAEKNKKLESSQPVDEVLSLELTPLDSKTTSEAVTQPTVATEAFIKRGLTLSEEAGLASTPNVANKYVKPKQSVNKAVEETAINPPPESAPLTGNLKETLQAKRDRNKTVFTDSSSNLSVPAFQAEAAQLAETNQKVAAKAFVANKSVKPPASKSALALLAVAGTLIIWLGLQGFAYVKTLAMPEMVAVKPKLSTEAFDKRAERATQSAAQSQNAQEAIIEPTSTESSSVAINNDAQDKSVGNQISTVNNVVIEKPNSDVLIASNPNQTNLVNENEAFKQPNSKKLKNSTNEANVADESSSENTSKRSQKHVPLQLITRAPTSGVDPTLLSAYQAFNRGEDASAQQQYRHVLQGDVRNVDALLGMAAIAQRQGRDADAVGWYQKVLEIEPRNTIAQSAIMSPQANADVVGTESRIKSMLALQPDGANLHAALGNLYAEQNQWPAAQEAYFNASRFAPNNADYAFNLAVSLDQLGKSSLALKQYQRALELLNKSGASSPDRAQLENRIHALQQ
jgi:tetratricopeptide (TPR) repeat protein